MIGDVLVTRERVVMIVVWDGSPEAPSLLPADWVGGSSLHIEPTKSRVHHRCSTSRRVLLFVPPGPKRRPQCPPFKKPSPLNVPGMASG